MLITFKCRDYHDVVLFGDVGETLLKAMGQSTRVPGILRAADVPEALDALQRYLERLPGAEQEEAATRPDERKDEDEDEDEEAAPPVSLRQRAMPLADMLKAAQAEESDVFWE